MPRMWEKDVGRHNLDSTAPSQVSGQGLSDYEKYTIAVNTAEERMSKSGVAFNDHQMNQYIDNIYESMMPTAMTGAGFRGHQNIDGTLTARGVLNAIDSGMSRAFLQGGYGLDYITDAAKYAQSVPGPNKWGQDFKDWRDTEEGQAGWGAQDYADLLDTAATVALMATGVPGIAAAAGKTIINQADNIGDAFTGRENTTMRKLDEDQRLQRGGTAALSIGLSAIPGIGRAANTAALGKGIRALSASDDTLAAGVKGFRANWAAGREAQKGIAKESKELKKIIKGRPAAKANEQKKVAEQALRTAEGEAIRNTASPNLPGLLANAQRQEQMYTKLAELANRPGISAGNPFSIARELSKAKAAATQEMYQAANMGNKMIKLSRLTDEARTARLEKLGAKASTKAGNLKKPKVGKEDPYKSAKAAGRGIINNAGQRFAGAGITMGLGGMGGVTAAGAYDGQLPWGSEIDPILAQRTGMSFMAPLFAYPISAATRGRISPTSIGSALGMSGGNAGAHRGQIIKNKRTQGYSIEDLMEYING